MQNIYRLYYLNIQGRAELIRLIFRYNGTPFEDIRFSYEEWPKLKGDSRFKFGQVPVLELPNGKILAESQTIARYLCQLFGYYPKDLETATKVEELREFIHTDIVVRRNVLSIFKDPQSKEEFHQEFFAKVLPKRLGYIEELLQGNSTGFLIGDSITIADFTLIDFAQRILFHREFIGRTQPTLEKLPNLSLYLQKRFDDPKYKEYLAQKPLSRAF